jgi:hypothetical protein
MIVIQWLKQDNSQGYWLLVEQTRADRGVEPVELASDHPWQPGLRLANDSYKAKVRPH